MLFDLVIKHGANKHVNEQDYSDIPNDPAHHSPFSYNWVVGMRVPDVGQKNYFILSFVFLSFLIILQSFSLEMLYDLYETTFERSLDAIKDMHMDDIIFVEGNVVLEKCFVWKQVL